MHKLLPLALLAALLLTACRGVTFSEAKIGPNQTETIAVPAPDSDTANLTLRFGAADQFRLQPGATGLVQGTVQYNVEQLKPTVTTSGSQVTIEQKLDNLTFSNQMHNAWDLKISDAIPLALTVEAGAYKGTYDLGGLRLRGLKVQQGAADSTYDFSKPNPDAMERLSFSSGAASLTVSNLANANAAAMRFDDSGAGNLLVNGGFEEGTAACGPGWSPTTGTVRGRTARRWQWQASIRTLRIRPTEKSFATLRAKPRAR